MPPMRAAVLATAVTLALAGPARAQETGGSFGGGDFSSGGGSDTSQSSSDWGSGSSSSSSDFGSSDWSSGGGGGGGCHGGGGLAVLFIVLVVVILFVFWGSFLRSIRVSTQPGKSWNQMDVTVIGLAIDWRARRKVQETLARIARHGETRSSGGLAGMLRETAVALLRAEVSWLYASARNHTMMPAGQAEARFREAAARARSGYRTEMVRAQQGSVSEEQAPALRARSEEGEGVVVITICAAARRELIDLPDPTDAAELRRALLDLASLGGRDLVALEVIWSPAAEEDRMSTLELESKYPDLRKIDETSIAGRIFCEYCRGPYPAELLECPHCGAAAPGAPAPPAGG